MAGTQSDFLSGDLVNKNSFEIEFSSRRPTETTSNKPPDSKIYARQWLHRTQIHFSRAPSQNPERHRNGESDYSKQWNKDNSPSRENDHSPSPPCGCMQGIMHYDAAWCNQTNNARQTKH